MKLFGFTLTKEKDKSPDTESEIISFVPKTDNDGTAVVSAAGAAYYGQFVDIDGTSITSDVELIKRYRAAAVHPECDSAIADIVNAAIVSDDSSAPVSLTIDELDSIREPIKKKIVEEFENVVKTLNFSKHGHDYFRRWYIDGRLYFHIIPGPKGKGISEIREIDPTRIKKIKEVRTKIDKATGIKTVEVAAEYFQYTDSIAAGTNQVVRIEPDSIVYVPSGLLDESRKTVISHLHKALKLVNNLRLMEDSLIIYRVARAPERRIFYIDVGNLPKGKAEEYVQSIMSKYRNKLVYDASTGEIRSDVKTSSMLEDFWLPRREGCISLTTKIPLLDGRTIELGQLIVEHKAGKENWVYSISPEGKVVPGLISWAGVTRLDTEVIDIHLDNGKVISTTPDHKFILHTGEKIAASDLKTGCSLMPFNLSSKVCYGKAEYPSVKHPSGEEEFVHRLVANYIFGKKESNEVIHHKDFSRTNNAPYNLVYMDAKDHFLLHSKLGTNSWSNGNYEEHCKNLSIAGKKFFNTKLGEKRKKEISEFNKTSELVWAGMLKGRQKLKQLRDNDKLVLSKDEYLKKWSPGLSQSVSVLGSKAAKERLQNLTAEELVIYKQKLSVASKINYAAKYSGVSIKEIGEIIKYELDHNINCTDNDIVNKIEGVFPQINSIKKLRRFLYKNGYETTSDFVHRYLGENYLSKRRLVKVNINSCNHTVVNVVYRTDKIDVGTLTIDEHHIHHDYHNFAIDSGVFIMNSRGTEISTLPSGANLSELDDVTYFQKKLYKALNVPASRLEGETGFNIGRATEISREEVKFHKFITRLRQAFSYLMIDLLRVQLLLKGIITESDWDDIRENIAVDYAEDNFFAELKEFEILTERLNVLDRLTTHVGKYYSDKWIRSNILRQSEQDIERIDAEIAEEGHDEPDSDEIE
jgi:hypothetical protein